MTTDTADTADKNMPIMEHLAELRGHLIIALGALLVGFGYCYYYATELYQFLAAPLADILQAEGHRRLIYTGLTEAFFTHVKLAFFSGFALAFPVIAWQGYAFIAPGLYKKERQVFLPFLIASPVLFILGAALVYYYIFPLAWRFFVGFESDGGAGGLPIELEARVSEYLELVLHLMLAFGLAFQLPVLLALLARAGIITGDWLRERRRYAIVVIIIAAAMLTPPDVISQIGLAVPMFLLYEASVLVCDRINKKRDIPPPP